VVSSTPTDLRLVAHDFVRLAWPDLVQADPRTMHHGSSTWPCPLEKEDLDL